MDFERHPDTNLLAAFLEGGLPRRDRRRLLRHLGDCPRCRRLVACASTVHNPPASSPSLRLQAWSWRWEAPLTAAAAFALVMGGLWMRSPGKVTAPLFPAQPVVHRLASTAPARQLRPTTVADRALANPGFFVVPPPPSALLASAEAPLPALPAVAPPPPNDEIQPSIDFSPLMTGFQDQPPAGGARAQLASWTGKGADAALPLVSAPGPQPSSPAPAAAAVSLRSGFEEGFTSESSASPPSGPLAPLAASSLGWAISRGGQVLRSFGAGVWAAVPLVPGVHFHALFTSDASVWAGGHTDELYVSHDHGQHWRRVHLPGTGAAAAPIRNIAFSDPQHGLITSGDGATWRTSDAGASWAKAN